MKKKFVYFCFVIVLIVTFLMTGMTSAFAKNDSVHYETITFEENEVEYNVDVERHTSCSISDYEVSTNLICAKIKGNNYLIWTENELSEEEKGTVLKIKDKVNGFPNGNQNIEFISGNTLSAHGVNYYNNILSFDSTNKWSQFMLMNIVKVDKTNEPEEPEEPEEVIEVVPEPEPEPDPEPESKPNDDNNDDKEKENIDEPSNQEDESENPPEEKIEDVEDDKEDISVEKPIEPEVEVEVKEEVHHTETLDDDIPKTGDNSNIAWIIIVGISAIFIVSLILIIKNR